MFSNLSLSDDNNKVSYPISDSQLPFASYISQSRALVEERREDLAQAGDKTSQIIQANSPFELYPENTTSSRLKYGALLIHGLLDSPFTFRDLAAQFQKNGILSRAILLPGHGTRPSDLLNVSYHQWIQAVRYGVETLAKEVDHVFLVGFSTGAALSLYQAMQDARIKGIVLLSPAIRIKAPIGIAIAWYKLIHFFNQNKKQWIYKDKEIDYTKYCSIPFNAVEQVAKLTKVLHEVRAETPMTTPIYMVMSREDETVSCHSAINFFSSQPNVENRLLLYTSFQHPYPDPRILTRLSTHKELNINHFSHMCIPFSPDNHHYGKNGDYIHASRNGSKHVIYGAYNNVEERLFSLMKLLRLTNYDRNGLTFNPDFNYLSKEVIRFIHGNGTTNSISA